MDQIRLPKHFPKEFARASYPSDFEVLEHFRAGFAQHLAEVGELV